MSNKNHFVVVEPHSDDAFLSLSQHIENWVAEKHRVTIVTIYPVNKHSLKDARNYAHAVGAHHVGFHENQIKPDNGHDLCRIHLPEGQLILPLAGAPRWRTRSHWSVRHYLEKPGCWYYLDMPYATIMKLGERFQHLMDGMEIVSYCKPPKRKWRHIPLFTGQRKYFYFNTVDKLQQTFEMVIAPSHYRRHH